MDALFEWHGHSQITITDEMLVAKEKVQQDDSKSSSNASTGSLSVFHHQSWNPMLIDRGLVPFFRPLK